MLDERLRQHRVGARVVAGVAQELRLGLPHLDALLDRHRRQVREILARLVDACPASPSIAADAKLGDPRALAVGHRAVALDGELVAARFLGDLREIELDRAVVAVVGRLEVLEQRLGAPPSPSSASTSAATPNS